MQQAASALSGCSNPTCLQVVCRDDISGVPWCSKIAKLSCLQSLFLTHLHYQTPCAPAAAHCLVRLTLSLQNVQGIDDFVSCSLLGKLRGLQDLAIGALQTMAVLGCGCPCSPTSRRCGLIAGGLTWEWIVTTCRPSSPRLSHKSAESVFAGEGQLSTRCY